jgi:hypothetical protein
MLSYNWKSQEIIKKLAQSLKSVGYDCWIDIERMTGDIMDAMAQAVDSCDMVIVAVSQGYHDSANCKREITYAYKKNKKKLYLLMDVDYQPDGWLGLLMGNDLYVDMRNGLNDENINNLTQQMALQFGGGGDDGGAKTPSSPVVVASPSSAASSSSHSPPSHTNIELLKAIGKFHQEKKH